MPKSRGRKPKARVHRSSAVPASFLADLGGGLSAVPPEISAGRLARLLAYSDPSDPLLLTALPAYLLDAIASAFWLPYERCLDDCMILAHAYAQLGIAAEVRAAELAITVRTSGEISTHGSQEPSWEHGMMHGHSVVWLPGPRHLVDSTTEQFAEITAGTDPVIIPSTPDNTPDAAPGQPFQLSLHRNDVLLTYRVAALAASYRMVDHPVASHSAPGYRRKGMNIASETIMLLAESFTPEQVQLIAHPRAAALAETIRGFSAEHIHNGDLRFALPGPNGTPTLTRIDRIPVPDGTPPIAHIDPDISRHLT